MFEFYVDLAGHEMVTDAGRAAMCRRKFIASSLQAESTKNGRPLESMGFNGKTF